MYHLAKRGVTNTVLLEKDQLTAGTTWHTAGLVWRLRPNDVEIQLLSHMVNLVNSLEEETGVNPGWINNGGIFIANNKERLDEYKRLGTIAKAFDIETYVLGPEETQKLYPLMRVDDIYGTLYSPADGTIDPNGLCQALTRSATRAGAKVLEGCPVTSIGTETTAFNRKSIVSVETPHGSIKTRHVVNCTGVWANYISSMVSCPNFLLSSFSLNSRVARMRAAFFIHGRMRCMASSSSRLLVTFYGALWLLSPALSATGCLFSFHSHFYYGVSCTT